MAEAVVTPVRGTNCFGNGTGACGVCGGEETDVDNPLIFCDGQCTQCTHLTCYGVLNPHIDEWLCFSCAVRKSVECMFCGHVGGLMKPLHNGRAAHVLCALSLDHVWFASSARLDGVSWDRHKLKLSRSSKCCICEQRGGATVKCCASSCPSSFHPMCAAEAGHRVELRSQYQVDRIPAWCPAHQAACEPPPRHDAFKEQFVVGVLDGHGVCNRSAWAHASQYTYPILSYPSGAPTSIGWGTRGKPVWIGTGTAGQGASSSRGVRNSGQGRGASSLPALAGDDEDEETSLGQGWKSDCATERALRTSIKLTLQRHEEAMLIVQEILASGDCARGIMSSDDTGGMSEVGHTLGSDMGTVGTVPRNSTPLLDSLRADSVGYGRKVIGVEGLEYGEDGLGSSHLYGKAKAVWKLMRGFLGPPTRMPPVHTMQNPALDPASESGPAGLQTVTFQLRLHPLDESGQLPDVEGSNEKRNTRAMSLVQTKRDVRAHATPLNVPATLIRAMLASAAPSRKRMRVNREDLQGNDGDVAFDFPQADVYEDDADLMDALVAATGSDATRPLYLGVKPKSQWCVGRGRGRGRGRSRGWGRGRGRVSSFPIGSGDDGTSELDSSARDSEGEDESDDADDIMDDEGEEEEGKEGDGDDEEGNVGPPMGSTDQRSSIAGCKAPEDESGMNGGGVLAVEAVEWTPHLVAERIRAAAAGVSVDIAEAYVAPIIPGSPFTRQAIPADDTKPVFFMLGDRISRPRGSVRGRGSRGGRGKHVSLVEVGARGAGTMATIDEVGLELWSSSSTQRRTQESLRPLRDSLRASYLHNWARDTLALRSEVERGMWLRLWAHLRTPCAKCEDAGVCTHRQATLIALVHGARQYASTPDGGLAPPSLPGVDTDSPQMQAVAHMSAAAGRALVQSSWRAWSVRWAQGHDVDDPTSFPPHMATAVLTAVKDTVIQHTRVAARGSSQAQVNAAIRAAFKSDPVLTLMQAPPENTRALQVEMPPTLAALAASAGAGRGGKHAHAAAAASTPSAFSSFAAPPLPVVWTVSSVGTRAVDSSVTQQGGPRVPEAARAYLMRRAQWLQGVALSSAREVVEPLRKQAAVGRGTGTEACAREDAGREIVRTMLEGLPAAVSIGSSGRGRKSLGLHVLCPAPFALHGHGRSRPVAVAQLTQHATLGLPVGDASITQPILSCLPERTAWPLVVDALDAGAVVTAVLASRLRARMVEECASLGLLGGGAKHMLAQTHAPGAIIRVHGTRPTIHSDAGVRGPSLPPATGTLMPVAAFEAIREITLAVEFLVARTEAWCISIGKDTTTHVLSERRSNLLLESRSAAGGMMSLPAGTLLESAFHLHSGAPYCVPLERLEAVEAGFREGLRAARLIEGMDVVGGDGGGAPPEAQVVGCRNDAHGAEAVLDVQGSEAAGEKVGAEQEEDEGYTPVRKPGRPRGRKRKVPQAPLLQEDEDDFASSAQPPRRTVLQQGIDAKSMSCVEEAVRSWHEYFQCARKDLQERDGTGFAHVRTLDHAHDRAAARVEALQARVQGAGVVAGSSEDSQSSSSVRCGVCGLSTEDGRACIGCDACRGWAHTACASVSPFAAAFWYLSYSCDACTKQGRPSLVREMRDPVLRDAWLAIASAGLSADQIRAFVTPAVVMGEQVVEAVSCMPMPTEASPPRKHPRLVDAEHGPLGVKLRVRPLHSLFPHPVPQAASVLGKRLAAGLARFYVILAPGTYTSPRPGPLQVVPTPLVRPPSASSHGTRRGTSAFSYADLAAGRLPATASDYTTEEDVTPQAVHTGRASGSGGGVTDAAALAFLKSSSLGRSTVDVAREERFRATQEAEERLARASGAT